MGDSIVIVGAGISGLLNAYYAFRAGLDVSVISKGPDPRATLDANTQDGATWKGEQTRYVTPYEGHPYLGSSPMYPNMKGAFSKLLSEGGWLGKKALSFGEKMWLKKRYCFEEESAFVSDLFSWYTHANITSMDLWDDLKREHPQLFNETCLTEDIVRFYETKSLFEWAKKLHMNDGVLRESFCGEDVCSEFSHLDEAWREGKITGVLRIRGFSFSLQRFLIALIDYLEHRDVTFLFDLCVTEIQYDEQRKVLGITVQCERGSDVMVFDHYVFHLGAYDSSGLLTGTPSEGKIHGVVGRWVVMPRPQGMKHSIKIHGDVYDVDGSPRSVVDQNLAVFLDGKYDEKIIVGGGYAYVGEDVCGIDENERQVMDEENHRTLRKFFPTCYKRALEGGSVEFSEKECVRSWSYDDVPVMDSLDVVGGGRCVFIGGTNTGTATIAPVQSLMVLRVLGYEVDEIDEDVLEGLYEDHRRFVERSCSILSKHGF